MLSFNIYKKLSSFDLNCNLEIGNEVVAIEGPSGSGKTTILNCISGIVSPDTGSVKINDEIVFLDNKNINVPIRERKVGYVFQNYALFPHMTVKDNILFGIKNNKNYDVGYVDYIMKVFRIEHLQKRKPREISGGERQRVALGRALAIRSKVLLLDEPFSALDKDTKEIVYEEFLEYKKNFKISILLITHDNYEAELLADKIVFIKEGRILSK